MTVGARGQGQEFDVIGPSASLKEIYYAGGDVPGTLWFILGPGFAFAEKLLRAKIDSSENGPTPQPSYSSSVSPGEETVSGLTSQLPYPIFIGGDYIGRDYIGGDSVRDIGGDYYSHRGDDIYNFSGRDNDFTDHLLTDIEKYREANNMKDMAFVMKGNEFRKYLATLTSKKLDVGDLSRLEDGVSLSDLTYMTGDLDQSKTKIISYKTASKEVKDTE